MNKFMLTFVAVLVFLIMNAVQAGAGEDVKKEDFRFVQNITVKELADINGLPVSSLLSKLHLKDGDAQLKINEVSKNYPDLTIDKIKSQTRKVFTEKQIEAHKNWKLIVLKFVLWVLLIAGLASAMTQSRRILYKPVLLLMSAAVFGIILGSDPNPLGTVKDGLILYANEGVLFKPRFVALTFLLVLVLIFGRMFCGWGCQVGVIQDFLYRLKISKIKVPFWLSNLIRTIVFISMITFAFTLHMDILGYVDPFKVYGLDLAALNLAFISILIMLSLFIYRPWCAFACPFGLLAWVANKFSFLRMRFNTDTCINCSACTRSCPTGAVEGLKNGCNSAECYLCDRCREACPNGSITYGR